MRCWRSPADENAADSLGKPYPAVDREMILKMAPDVVIRLVPDGDRKPQLMPAGGCDLGEDG